MFVNQLEESSSYVCFYVLDVRGIVPYSVVLSVSSLRSVAVVFSLLVNCSYRLELRRSCFVLKRHCRVGMRRQMFVCCIRVR